MNRLSPWIVRDQRAVAVAAAMPAPRSFSAAAESAASSLDDVRLFLTGWVGGLVFFGTLIG